MNTLWKYMQYAYLIVALVFLVEAILVFNTNKQKALLMFGFAIFISFVFWFKRRFRKKITQINKQANK